ncbi:unnamed protein product [Lymnaea stagnalis]|uniref:Uncharacterized protein n=1 Tax=Lymnaea stagnalis TaxID=6523 RepID=A0AAV2HFS8_LYMST
MVLGKKSDKEVKGVRIRNNTVGRRIDEMSEDNEIQLVEKRKTKRFSLHMDKSTSRGSEAIVITHVRYIDK